MSAYFREYHNWLLAVLFTSLKIRKAQMMQTRKKNYILLDSILWVKVNIFYFARFHKYFRVRNNLAGNLLIFE